MKSITGKIFSDYLYLPDEVDVQDLVETAELLDRLEYFLHLYSDKLIVNNGVSHQLSDILLFKISNFIKNDNIHYQVEKLKDTFKVLDHFTPTNYFIDNIAESIINALDYRCFRELDDADKEKLFSILYNIYRNTLLTISSIKCYLTVPLLDTVLTYCPYSVYSINNRVAMYKIEFEEVEDYFIDYFRKELENDSTIRGR